jgi:hypothetical protein
MLACLVPSAALGVLCVPAVSFQSSCYQGHAKINTFACTRSGCHAVLHPGHTTSLLASGVQASLSQMPALSGGASGISLLQELSGVLRRALTQQAPVRAALYEGLLQVRGPDVGHPAGM